jgi:hypothetical protein
VTRSQWEFARKGLAFINYGFWCQIGSLGALVLIMLLSWMGAQEPFLLALACLPGLVNWILAGVGCGFIVAGPRRGNLLGLAIALASVAGAQLIVVLYIGFGDPSGLARYGAFGSSVNWPIFPTSFIVFAVMVLAKTMVTWIFLAGVLEIGRYVMLMLYMKELARFCKNKQAAGNSLMLMIALPCSLLGSIVILYLGIEILKEGQPGKTMLQILAILYVIMKLGAYAFIYWLTIQTSSKVSDAAYDMY